MITIKDIALKAGVSRGTVDRVLHNRGSVTEDKRQRVQRIIDEMGFKPNEFASLIASGKTRRIVCLIPHSSAGDIWEITSNGIMEAEQAVRKMGVSVTILTYNQYDLDSFNEACTKLLESNPSGVVLAPMFRNATFNLVRQLTARGIPYTYIDTKLDDDNYLEFYGLPMYHSGYLGARLLTDNAPESIREIINVRISRDKDSLSDPTLIRSAGFMDYIKEHLPWCTVKEVWINPRSTEETFRVMDEVMQPQNGQDRPRHLIMFNSRVHIVAAYLKQRGFSDCRVVGYDKLSQNIQALHDGTVTYVIAQHSDTRAAQAVQSMADHLVFGHPITKRDHYSMMDILNSCNCDYY